MQTEARSPYTPIPMHVLHAYYESTDRSLALELSFDTRKTAGLSSEALTWSVLPAFSSR